MGTRARDEPDAAHAAEKRAPIDHPGCTSPGNPRRSDAIGGAIAVSRAKPADQFRGKRGPGEGGERASGAGRGWGGWVGSIGAAAAFSLFPLRTLGVAGDGGPCEPTGSRGKLSKKVPCSAAPWYWRWRKPRRGRGVVGLQQPPRHHPGHRGPPDAGVLGDGLRGGDRETGIPENAPFYDFARSPRSPRRIVRAGRRGAPGGAPGLFHN